MYVVLAFIVCHIPFPRDRIKVLRFVFNLPISGLIDIKFSPYTFQVAFCYSVKKTVYLCTWSFVVCLVYFHLRHRLYCEPGGKSTSVYLRHRLYCEPGGKSTSVYLRHRLYCEPGGKSTSVYLRHKLHRDH